MVSYSAKLDSRTKQHTQFGVSVSNGSRDMARTKVAGKKRKKNEHRRNYIASPTGIANDGNTYMLLKVNIKDNPFYVCNTYVQTDFFDENKLPDPLIHNICRRF